MGMFLFIPVAETIVHVGEKTGATTFKSMKLGVTPVGVLADQ